MWREVVLQPELEWIIEIICIQLMDSEGETSVDQKSELPVVSK